jgi:hypothetical protein
VFIKHDITENVDPVHGNVQTLVTFVHRAIIEEHILKGTVGEFGGSVWAEVWLVGTPEDLKLIVVGLLM